jgi:hypothetical protein
MYVQVERDWVWVGTAGQLEKEIGNGFKFSGPGFYLTNTDTVLIIPREFDDRDSMWKKTWPVDTVFVTFCWNTQHQNTIWSVCSLAPVRVDDRE